MNAQPIVAHARKLGAFYTPRDLADVLAEWVSPDGEGHILDPSVGEGNLLLALARQSISRGDQAPGTSLWGVDVAKDVTATASAALAPYGLRRHQVVCSDFLRLRLSDLAGAPFAGVIANPPYIRHHWLGEDAKHAAAAAMEHADVTLSAKASTWAYFLVHAVQFVALGGRMAFVLPGAVLQADYAPAALDHVCGHFGDVRLLRVHAQIFDEVQEETVVLLASERGHRCSVPRPQQVLNVSALRRALQVGAGDTKHDETVDEWKLSLLSREMRALWNELYESSHVLDDLATLSIGVVTGANDFFIRAANEGILQVDGVGSVPIARRTGWLQAAMWTRQDLKCLDDAGAQTRLMLLTRAARRSPRVRAELARAEKAQIHLRSHCAHREPWYIINDERVPDAFVHYMRGGTPKIVANQARGLCTNAIHRIWWRTPARRPTASSWTSLFALAAELFGRHYGGGVLKLEPSDARRLPLVTSDDEKATLQRIDQLAREGEPTKAQEFADKTILMQAFDLTSGDIKALRDAHDIVASVRRRTDTLN